MRKKSIGFIISRSSIYLIAAVSGLFIISCGSTREIQAIESGKKEREIDTTLYDLTYLEGVRQKMMGNYGEALDKFEDALRIYPESDAANFQISQISAMRRDYKNAVDYGRRAAEIDSQNSWYLMSMANIFMQTDNIDTAIIWLERVMEVEPDKEDIKYQLANMYMQTGKGMKAEEIFEEFYDEYGGNKQLLMSLINIKVNNEKYDEAVEILNEELRRDGDSNNDLKGVLAEVYRKQGKINEAEEIYNTLLKEENAPESTDYSYIEFLLEQGKYDELFAKVEEMVGKEGKLEDRIGVFARLLEDSVILKDYKKELVNAAEILMKDNEEDPTIALLVSEVYRSTGNTEKEIQILIEFLKKDKSQYFIWENLLLKLNDNQRIEEMRKYSGEASTMFNKAPLPKILHAFSLIEAEEYTEAQEELDKVRILVNNDERYIVQILPMEAEIAYRLNDIEKASEKFDKVLELEPDNTLVLNNYAYYLAESDIRLKDAKEMIERCIKIERNVTYMDTYAWILYKMDKLNEAERIMREIFETVNVTDAEILEHYGYIKKKLNKCEEAVALWQTALKYDRTKDYLIEEIKKCVDE